MCGCLWRSIGGWDEIFDLAGEQHADLDYDEREPEVADEEPSLGSSDRCLSQEDWSEGGAGLIVPEAELDGADDKPSDGSEGETISTWRPIGDLGRSCAMRRSRPRT